MALHEDIKFLDSQLESIQTVEELRTLLSRGGLKLIVVLLTNKFSCLEWNITQKQVSKFVLLSRATRILVDFFFVSFVLWMRKEFVMKWSARDVFIKTTFVRSYDTVKVSYDMIIFLI